MKKNKIILAVLILTLIILIFSACTRDSILPINHAPVITSTAITSATVGVVYIYNVEATDPDGDIITYSLTTTPNGMNINSSTGAITWNPITSGSFGVTVEVSDGDLSVLYSFNITVSTLSEIVVYRALCAGVGDYIQDINSDLPAPPYDVDRMIYTLDKCQFGSSNTSFSNICYLKDWQATKSNILYKITSCCFSEADNNDVSYFYFSGHGFYLDNTAYICPADRTYFLDSSISVDELESALSSIPGTKVVIIDTCNSGGFIGKGEGGNDFDNDNLETFNNSIINTFLMGQSKGLLTTNQYKVLTSCHYNQSCGESSSHPIDGNPYGLFTAALCEGCGYNSFASPYPADDNLDSKVSLQEAYMYINSWVEDLNSLYVNTDITQDVQVYPSDSDFTIVEY